MAELFVLENKEKEIMLSVKEQAVAELILEYSRDEYDRLLENADWEIFCQMSSFREGLLNWYPFCQESRALLISEGFGALVGVLARSVAAVDVLENCKQRAECIVKRYEDCANVKVMVGDIEMFTDAQKYDYILLESAIVTMDTLDKILMLEKKLLKKSGRMLFVCENRLGMKHMCGVPDGLSGRPFGGMVKDEQGKRITRSALIEKLAANLPEGAWKLYYPFPDYELPQAVYTDAYLPKESIRDRVIPYYTEEQQRSLVYLEDGICDDLIANGVFHTFANSFLVECGSCGFVPEVKFAALSTDRGKEHGFATIITTRDTVIKKILHSEGKESLNLIYQNQQRLIGHGIRCVEQKLMNDAIEMPFVKGRTLIEYLKYLYLNYKDKVVNVYDELYDSILASSEHVEFYKCELQNEKLNKQNAGVILQDAYIDMIPYNCFMVDDKLVFYDQEFIRHNFPAKYVLFRALRYTYVYITEAESIIPLQYFKDRFDLNEVWQVFEHEEAVFVEDNRNYNLLAPFYRWAGVEQKQLDENICRLTGGTVQNTDVQIERKVYDLSVYEKDVQLREVQKVQMGLFRKFVEVCEENNLSYCAIYGTLLGAIRHNGYVPWDDDLDLAMPRADYDELVYLAPKVFKEPYFLQTPESDDACFYGGYMKLRNCSTTALEKKNEGHVCNQGIWIDIFPLDDVLANPAEKKEQFQKICHYQRLLAKKIYPDARVLRDISVKEEQEYEVLSKKYSHKYLCEKLHEYMAFYGCELSDKVAIMARYRSGKQYVEYDRKDFEFLIQHKFEDMMLNIPVGYRKNLEQEYGKEYMLYPEEKERVPHHRAVFDTKRSYVDYMRENGYN